MSDGADHNVPPEDIDYAVENALWIASCCQEAGDRRSFMDVFASQLETHWDCLLALWAGDGQEDDSVDETVQQTLVTDGGRDNGFDRHEVDCRCGKTTVGETLAQAEHNHLLHFLNDHDDTTEEEREMAREQLEQAREQRSVETATDRDGGVE